MCLIQPLKFITLKTGCFKMPRLQAPRLQTGVFQTGITVASGQNLMVEILWGNLVLFNLKTHILKYITMKLLHCALCKKKVICTRAC